MPSSYTHKDWRGSTDGTPWMQRTLIRLFRVLPQGLLYGCMALSIPFYVAFDGRARRASRNFFRRLGYGKWQSEVHVFRNMYNMGKVVMDRFAAYAGKKFRLVYSDVSIYTELTSRPEGLLILGSHVGNYEMVGYMLPTPKPMKVLVYAGETETMMQNRQRLFGNMNIAMIPVKEDMSHLFALNNAMADGEIVSMPADRCLGSAKVLRLPFLGQEASFPAGPFTFAVQREAPVLVAFVMKEGRRDYRIVLDKLDIPEQGSRNEKVMALASQYVSSLERVAQEWPDQWYNFYDFWAE